MNIDVVDDLKQGKYYYLETVPGPPHTTCNCNRQANQG